MATLVVRNLPDALHEALRQRADRHHRSINKETISLIEAGVASAGVQAPLSMPVKVPGAMGLTGAEFERALTDRTYARALSLDDMERYMDELRADRDDVQP
ncbi:MAG: FitA-like ribbon-helix-helix domain-containing protein [Rhodanobacteraceae bacterium]